MNETKMVSGINFNLLYEEKDDYTVLENVIDANYLFGPEMQGSTSARSNSR